MRLSVDICPHGMSSSSEANRLSSAGSSAISASIEGLVVRSRSSFTSVFSAMMISRVNSQARLEFRSFQWTSSVATMSILKRKKTIHFITLQDSYPDKRK